MNDVCAAPSKRLYDSMLVRNGELRQSSGIEGLRAIAFDYSGKCGTPAVMVMVDRITGGGKKVWTWQRPSADVDVKVENNSFTIAYPDATMRATFVTPDAVEIKSVDERLEIGTARKGFHGTVNRIKATGGDEYFVVLTFQRTKPPEVTVDGQGLRAKVTVGRQTIHFDGRKIVLGE
jgi:hypothetical protein